jgi:predicted TIM-barrel fold metal-dependent hydrolase
MDTMGADRTMFSVDYPYEDMAEADRHEIGYENGRRLLQL